MYAVGVEKYGEFLPRNLFDLQVVGNITQFYIAHGKLLLPIAQ
jgi:hypothetical protein